MRAETIGWVGISIICALALVILVSPIPYKGPAFLMLGILLFIAIGITWIGSKF